MNQSLDRLARDVGREFELELDRLGLIYRLFSRAKSEESIERKMKFKNYDTANSGKIMQDIIGVRITLYFYDDLEIIHKIFKSHENFIDETIDDKSETVFKPERVNLIFKLDSRGGREVADLAISRFKFIDKTYELQLRTVLSEGWHEVDHDLRYKCQNDWNGSSDIARTFNGVYASLVTNDWSILTIFEQLSYRHYKSKNWSAMLRHKLRLRFRDEELDSRLTEVLDSDNNLAKTLYRTERSELIKKMHNEKIRVPFTLSNMVYLINSFYLRDERITQLTPDFIKKIQIADHTE